MKLERNVTKYFKTIFSCCCTFSCTPVCACGYVCVCVRDSSIFIGRNLIEISEARFCASPECAQATQWGMEGLKGARIAEAKNRETGRQRK